MNSQDLNQAWSEMQGRVQTLTNLEISAREAKTRRRLTVSPTLDVVAGALALFFAGSFVGDHFETLHATPILALPAAFVFLCGFLWVNFGVRGLILARQTSFSVPVAEAQANLLKLEILRLQHLRFAFALFIPLWFLPVIFVVQVAGDPRAGMVLTMPKLGLYVLAGVAVAAAVEFGLRKLGHDQLLRAVRGTDVKRAQDELDNYRDLAAT